MGRQLKNYNYSSALFETIIILSLISLGESEFKCSKISNLTSYKLNMQEKVKKMSDALVQQYTHICEDKIKNCLQKSFDLCQGTSKRMCLNNFPTLSHCIFKPGIWISNSSGVRISNVLQKNNLSDNARKFICASALIEPVFEELRTTNDFQFSFAYIGSSSGAVRVSPAFKQGTNLTTNQCTNYDPRKRPWYVSAITGSKTTIILLDVSGSMTSMHPGVRLTNAKVTLQIIFGTLNSFDYVGVVVFSKSAHTLIFDTIVVASSENKEKILNEIKILEVDNSGSTNYTAALQVAITMLYGASTYCGETAETVFLLLTDGYTENDNPQNISDISAFFTEKFTKLNKSIQNFKLISFVYGIEKNIIYTLVQQLTCLYQGIVFRIWDGIDEFGMVEKLTSYYIFLSEGINKNLIKPIWSEVYEDAFGFGKIVTVTIPIYVEGRINKVVGVAGIDVLIEEFEKCGYNLKNVQNLLRNKPQCFKSTLDPNQLLYLQCLQGNIPCSNNNLNQTCSNQLNLTDQQICGKKVSKDIFYPTVFDTSDDDEKCCAISVRVFLLISMPTLGVLVIIFVIFLLYKKGVLQKIFRKLRKQKVSVQEDNDDTVSVPLMEDTNLKYDPQKKYKLAQQNGIKVYRQDQFSI